MTKNEKVLLKQKAKFLNKTRLNLEIIEKNDNLICKCGHTRIRHLIGNRWTSCTVGTCPCMQFKWKL